jgi:hypothetical protein
MLNSMLGSYYKLNLTYHSLRVGETRVQASLRILDSGCESDDSLAELRNGILRKLQEGSSDLGLREGLGGKLGDDAKIIEASL